LNYCNPIALLLALPPAVAAKDTTNNWKVSARGDVVLGSRDNLWARYAVQD
jgi:hypothetical protein